MTKEEILADNDIGSGSLYFNRAMDAMETFAKQESKQDSIAFRKWETASKWVELTTGNFWREDTGEEITTEQLYRRYHRSKLKIKKA